MATRPPVESAFTQQTMRPTPGSEPRRRTRNEQLQDEIARLQENIAAMDRADTALKAGFKAGQFNLVTQEELMAALSHRDDTDRADALERAIEMGTSRARAQQVGEDTSWFQALGQGVAHSIVGGITGIGRVLSQSFGGAAQAMGAEGVPMVDRFGEALGQASAGLAGLTPGMGMLGEKLGVGLGPMAGETPNIDRVENAVFNFMGIPEGPVERQLYQEALPNVSFMVGEMAGVIAMLGLTRKLPGKPGTGKIVAPTTTAGKLALGVGLPASAGVTLGLDLYTNPDADAMHRVVAALRGPVGVMLMAGVLRGRPYGTVARRIHQLETTKQLGTAQRFGAALTTSPYLTTGHMMQSALIGTVLGTAQAANEGLPPDQAIQAGIDNGVLWLGTDILSTRLGGAARWLKVLTNVRMRAATWLQETLGMSTRGAVRGGAAAQIGLNASIGAAAGAGVAATTGYDPKEGALAGAVAGTVGIGFYQRGRAGTSILPREIWQKLEDGALHKLTREEVLELAEFGMRSAVEDEAADLSDEAMKVLLAHGMARDVSMSVDEQLLHTELQRVTTELQTMMPGEVLPTDPSALQFVMTKARRAGEINERLAQILREKYAELEPGVQAQAAASQAKGVVISAERALQAQWDQLRRARVEREARLTANERTYQARVATNAAETFASATEPLRRAFNVDFDAAMVHIADELTPAQVYREIAVATGETVDAIRTRLGHANVEGAIGELAHLRASAGSPRKVLSTAVIRHEGTTTEFRQALTNMRSMDDELSAMLTDINNGQPVTPQRLRAMLQRTGGGSIRQEGPFYRIKFPFVGEVVDTIPAALRKAKMYLKDFQPAIVMAGPAGQLMTNEKGSLVFTDENGQKGVAWQGVAGMASLAAVGILLTKGMPVRYKGMIRQMRSWLAKQTFRFPDAEMRRLGIPGREALIEFREDGVARAVVGGRESVGTPNANRAIVFSLHNHPRYEVERGVATVEQLATGQDRAFTQLVAQMSPEQRVEFARGLDLINHYPSPQDIASLLFENKGALNPAVFAVVTPHEGRITVVSLVDKLPRGITRATQAEVSLAAWETARRSAYMEMGRQVSMSGTAYAGMVVGRYVTAFGEDAYHNIMEGAYRKAFPDGVIVRNVTDDALEKFIAHRLESAASRRLGVAEQADAINTMQFFTSGITPHLTSPAEKLASDGAWRKTVRDFFFGPPTPTGRAVAPAGAGRVRRILPVTVTPSAVAKTVIALDPMRNWATQHGMNLVTHAVDGVRTFALLHKGETVASATSLANLRTEMMRVAKEQTDAFQRAQVAGVRPGQGGFTRNEFQRALGMTQAGAAVGTLLGSWSGGMLQNYFRLHGVIGEGDEPSYKGAVAGGVVGMLVGTLMGAKAGGMTLKPAAERALRFFAVPENELHLESTVARMLGKGSPHTLGGKRVNPGGPTKRDFFHFPVSKQVEHLTLRLKDTVNTQNVSLADKQARFKSTLAKFTPTHIPTALYDSTFKEIIGLAQGAGYTREQAAQMWRGMLMNMATPFTMRATRRGNPDLSLLAKKFSDRFGIGDDAFEEMRNLVTTTQVLSGHDAPQPVGASRAIRTSMRATPDSEEFKTLHDVASLHDVNLRQADQYVSAGIAAGIRSVEQFVTIAKKLMVTPGKQGTGSDILRLYNAVMMTTSNQRNDFTADYSAMLKLFKGVKLEDRKLVRKIVEDQATAELALKNNPVMYEKAMQWKALIDKWRDKLGLAPEQIIERYYPHIYNTRTIEDLRQKGVLDLRGVYVGMGTGIPEYKVMRNMLSRSYESPIGEIIEDPLEAGMIYLTGATRKFHLDRLVQTYDSKFFKELATTEPFVAGEMARWVLDIFGVPTTGHLKASAFMRNMGLRLDEYAAAFNFNGGEFAREVIDKYFITQGAASKFINFVRGAEFYAKIGGSFITSMVNLSQVGNSATDLGISSLFIGGVPFTVHAGILGRAGEALEERGMKQLSGFIDPHAAGRKKLHMARQYGVWTDSTQNLLDRLDSIQFLERGGSVGLSLMSALGGGLGSAAFLGDEEGRSKEFVGGAIGGALLSGPRPSARAIRWALLRARNLVVAPFEFTEFLNRGVTAGAALREASIARKVLTSPTRAAIARGGEALEQIALGAGTGAAVGRLSAQPGEENQGTLTGAVAGGAIGAGLAAASRKAPRINRVNAEMDFLVDNSGRLPIRRILHEQGPPTEAEIAQWYMRQVLDQTQFRFGREARARYLRTPVGEVAGALQSFTINQMEFTGQRLQSFFQSMTVAQAGDRGVVSAAASGQLDTRIFRHMMLIMATGSALTALSAAVDSDKSFEYWASRIGFGLLPMIHWNEDASQWQLGDVGKHLLGPVVNDISNAFRTILRLNTDPVAAAAWDTEADRLARQFIGALRQIESTPAVVGAAADKLQLEGLREMAMEMQGPATAASRPVSTVRRGGPALPPRQRREGEGGGGSRKFGGGDNQGGGSRKF